MNHIDELFKEELFIVDGSFTKGEMITVHINGKTVTRKVYRDGYADALYIVYENIKYFQHEFEE